MEYVCEDCSETFSRSYSMLRHRRESCMFRFVNAESAKRRRVDVATPTPQMRTCVTCNIAVPHNQLGAHQRTLQHRNNSCLPLSQGVQIVQTAFKKRIATYRVSSENFHIDFTIFFEEIKAQVLSLISEVVAVRGALKINMVVVGLYILPAQDSYSEKSFNTCNEIVTVASDLEEVYRSFVEAMKVQSTEFQEKDSGML